MKTLLALCFLTLTFSQSLMAETITYNTTKKCENNYEESFTKHFMRSFETKKCAIAEARLFADIACEEYNGKIQAQSVHALNCETKMYKKKGTAYNRIICKASTRTRCKI